MGQWLDRPRSRALQQHTRRQGISTRPDEPAQRSARPLPGSGRTSTTHAAGARAAAIRSPHAVTTPTGYPPHERLEDGHAQRRPHDAAHFPTQSLYSHADLSERARAPVASHFSPARPAFFQTNHGSTCAAHTDPPADGNLRMTQYRPAFLADDPGCLTDQPGARDSGLYFAVLPNPCRTPG